MKLWITRNKRGTIRLFQEKPTLISNSFFSLSDGFGMEIKQTNNNRTFLKHITFENSPQEVELSLFHPVQLTRDYFAKHNWEIVIHDPDENGFILWEAKWKRSMEEGSPYYSDLTVTNMMHEDRFCVSGKTGEGNVEYLMAYTEEDLENILKALAIYDYYKKES